MSIIVKLLRVVLWPLYAPFTLSWAAWRRLVDALARLFGADAEAWATRLLWAVFAIFAVWRTNHAWQSYSDGRFALAEAAAREPLAEEWWERMRSVEVTPENTFVEPLPKKVPTGITIHESALRELREIRNMSGPSQHARAAYRKRNLREI